MGKWENLAGGESLQRAVAALKSNGIEAFVFENGEEARKKVLEILPQGAEVMTMTSVTLDTIGVTKEINESGKYNSVKKKLMSMDRSTQGGEMRKLGAGPEWAGGSVHAVTEDGKVLVASATGSQLPAYAYAAGKVIWVVGAQKVVKNQEDGLKRIREHTFPLEDKRAQQAYGVHSSISKLLIVNKEAVPGRITMILVKEKLGF